MDSAITIRKYRNTDCEKISKLFYETVHAINAKDYSDKQLFAWAKNENQLQTRQDDLLEQNTLIAEINEELVGFASITNTGYLDLLFVHKDYQRQGVAKKLCDEAERLFPVVTTYASITAKPFFEKRGYAVICENVAERLGVKLINYKMQKNLNEKRS